MANVLDFSNLTTVTILNGASDVEVFDAGTRPEMVKILKSDLRPGEEYVDAGKDENNKDLVEVKRKYIPGTRRIQLWKTNSYVTLEPGDSVKLAVKYSAELAYYKSLENDEIQVEVATAEDSGKDDSGSNTPGQDDNTPSQGDDSAE